MKNERLERFNKLEDLEKIALLNLLGNSEQTRMFIEFTHKQKSTSRLKKDDLSDFIGHCQEIECWFDKVKLWNKVFDGQVELGKHDNYLNLVVNPY